ncbi:hypothetical protein [Corynebacterium liangguodongii]|uniref:hypothetical protein n=1 Tax=Corynebacterium liangguodongii TaxID=2079535 RepID=UPI0011B294C4|nr:hypothetical protein [Corynebacterium liangguodongii]
MGFHRTEPDGRHNAFTRLMREATHEFRRIGDPGYKDVSALFRNAQDDEPALRRLREGAQRLVERFREAVARRFGFDAPQVAAAGEERLDDLSNIQRTHGHTVTHLRRICDGPEVVSASRQGSSPSTSLMPIFSPESRVIVLCGSLRCHSQRSGAGVCPGGHSEKSLHCDLSPQP